MSISFVFWQNCPEIMILLMGRGAWCQKSINAVADPGGAEGAMAPPGPVKIGHKKMATEGGRIDFMFLGPPLPGRWIRYCNAHLMQYLNKYKI